MKNIAEDFTIEKSVKKFIYEFTNPCSEDKNSNELDLKYYHATELLSFLKKQLRDAFRAGKKQQIKESIRQLERTK